MPLTKERVQAAIPFWIICLLIAWLGFKQIHTSRFVNQHIRQFETTRGLLIEVASLQDGWEKTRNKLQQLPMQAQVPNLDDLLLSSHNIILKLRAIDTLNKLDDAQLTQWQTHIAQTSKMAKTDVADADAPFLEPTGKQIQEDLREMEQALIQQQAFIHNSLNGQKLPSPLSIFFVTSLTILLVFFLENIFIGKVQKHLITFRDILLSLNQNHLHQNTEIELELKGWVGNLFPLPKIAHLFNCFMNKHRDVIHKIQISAENCENATGLIRSCHKEIYEGTRVQANSTDETSSSSFQMTATLNEVATNVQSLSRSAEESSSSVQMMESSIRQISDSSEELFGLVDNSSSSINEMVVSIGQIRENLNSLTNSVESTTSAVSQIDASMKEVAQMAKDSAALSQKTTTETSEQGVKAVQKTIEGMHRIRESVEGTNCTIKILNQRSEEIGEILEVIGEVSEQTNLLALNASIIAAQAGEHGKGFAVVADEIKALAERTAASIGQIDKAISSVQTETDTVSKSMQQSVQQVQEGVALSEETKRVLERILTQSQKASEMSWKIEKTAIEQVQSIGHVNSETQNINELVHQITTAVQEQDKGGSIIREMVEKLKNFTYELKKSMKEETITSKMIAAEIENFFNKIQEINRAIQEHRKGSEQIARSMERIRIITEENINMTDDMNSSIRALSVHNDELLIEIHKSQLNKNDQNQLRLGIVPLETKAKMQAKFIPLARHLENKLQMKVEIRVAKDLETAVRELGTGKTDIAYLTPSTYIEAKKLYGIEVILKAIRNQSPFYRSVIAVKDGSPIRSVLDIKGKTMGFGDKKSTSSFLVPKAMLSEKGISLKDLGSYTFLGNHDSVAWAIVNGDVDAGSLLEPVANKFIDKGLKILKISNDIPEFNFCINPDMDNELKAKITEVLLTLDEENPEDRRVLKTIEYDYNGFMSATDNDYSGIEEMMLRSEQDVA